MVKENEKKALKIDSATAKILLSPDYKPSEDEDFMNAFQIEYFRRKLNEWKKDLLVESSETLDLLRQDNLASADANDRASMETEHGLELRTRDRYRKLIAKIDESLRTMDTGEYGYCEVSGEKIPLERLEARPTASMTVFSQEAYERGERTRKDDRE